MPPASGREVNRTYREKLVTQVMIRYARKLFVPLPIRKVWAFLRSLKYIKKGISSLLNRKLTVAVLDATAIGISLIRGDMKTASSVMFLLRIGETLEEWTHKKSVNDLAGSMSLRTPKVWMKTESQPVLVDSDKIREKDQVIVYVGSVIPFDGVVV